MDNLETYFDILERAAMTKALEKGDEKLAGEAAEAREKLRQEFEKLRRQSKQTNGKQPNWEANEYRLEKERLQLKLAELEAEGERIREEFRKLQSKHPCDETCPACWGLAKELTEAQERIRELEK